MSITFPRKFAIGGVPVTNIKEGLKSLSRTSDPGTFVGLRSVFPTLIHGSHALEIAGLLGLLDDERSDLTPTGRAVAHSRSVVKTELTKALAQFLFDSPDAMVRIDMSEFMEKHAVSRLVGAPPGYVGYEEGGYLTEAVRRKPYSVILLDEVEKAHPDVFNILLQVLDDGRLTDGQGRTVDFKNAVIIMTSNLGSDLIQEHYLEYSYDQMKEMLMGVLSKQFRPEFLNRLDETVVFHPLDSTQIRSIAKIQLARLEQRLAERQYQFSITDAALDKLAEVGFDPLYGARPLKRAIQQHLENPLAQALLQGNVAPGSTVRLDHDGSQFVVTSD